MITASPHKCAYCGNTFLSKHNNQIYCSASCRNRANYSPKTNSRHSRACHDCGMPTNDYRCSSCREKWQRKHNVVISQ